MKLRHKNVIQLKSSANKLKRRIGDSTDNSLYINEYSRKARKKEKKTSISSKNSIDVETYSL